VSGSAKTAAVVSGILFAVGSLLYLGYRSHEVLPKLSRPDVDVLLRTMVDARTADDVRDNRKRILAMGRVATDRLRVIARDPARSPEVRCGALELLRANPEAVFDILSLIDDPDTQIRDTARDTVRGCMAGLAASRDPRTDTEARLVKRWFELHRGEGYGALEYRSSPIEPSEPPDTTLPPLEIFRRLTCDGSFSTSSPYIRDLRALEPAATADLIRLASTTDSIFQRGNACFVLGVLGDTAGIAFLESRMAASRDQDERILLHTALSFGSRLRR
jgi:hypothetical protein